MKAWCISMICYCAACDWAYCCRRADCSLMDRIRAIAQPELGWSDDRWAQEVSDYTTLWNRCYSV